MGNNTAFEHFEQYTMAVYEAGVLTKNLLNKFMDVHAGEWPDPGGFEGMTASDGLNVLEVVLSLNGKLTRTNPKDPDKSEEYWDWLFEEFRKIAKKHRWYRTL